MGQTRDPHLWYYYFDTYALDYLLQKGTEDIPARFLISDKVRTLAHIDAEDGSQYLETLATYLDHKQNATHTAEALYMHRTSLLRRIERIEKLTGIDFNDPDQVLYVQLSLKLLS